MKRLLECLIFFFIFFSAKSQTDFRTEIYSHLKQNDIITTVEIIEENLDSIIDHRLLEYKELYLIYMMNDSLLINSDLRKNLKSFNDDSLNMFLFEKSLKEYENFNKKIEKLATNKVELDYHKLYLEIVLYPTDNKEFDMSYIRNQKRKFIKYYKQETTQCPDSIYDEISSISLLKRTFNISISGNYYGGVLLGTHYDKNINYTDGIYYDRYIYSGLGLNYFWSLGFFAFEYSYNLNFIKERYYQREGDGYIEVKMKPALGCNLGFGFALLNTNRLNISTLASFNVFNVLNDDESIGGIKTNVSIKSKKRRGISNNTYWSLREYSNYNVSIGVYFKDEFYFSFGISYGLGGDYIKKKQRDNKGRL